MREDLRAHCFGYGMSVLQRYEYRVTASHGRLTKQAGWLK
ncbi:hypothetical protein Z948_551 [Sulfitobacter donghicola DSW-25 = KCTC 12864 = JCM 14565]|nr:hypothetical protein Z948_551 [Sulfitobacter donghicola DSW-25 = KCTC 12864 = JCM 14565]